MELKKKNSRAGKQTMKTTPNPHSKSPFANPASANDADGYYPPPYPFRF
jgi:hypothetical protein